MATHSGDVRIKSLYASKACFSCHRGNIDVGNSHGNLSASTEEGNIAIREYQVIAAFLL